MSKESVQLLKTADWLDLRFHLAWHENCLRCFQRWKSDLTFKAHSWLFIWAVLKMLRLPGKYRVEQLKLKVTWLHETFFVCSTLCQEEKREKICHWHLEMFPCKGNARNFSSCLFSLVRVRKTTTKTGWYRE